MNTAYLAYTQYLHSCTFFNKDGLNGPKDSLPILSIQSTSRESGKGYTARNETALHYPLKPEIPLKESHPKETGTSLRQMYKHNHNRLIDRSNHRSSPQKNERTNENGT